MRPRELLRQQLDLACLFSRLGRLVVLGLGLASGLHEVRHHLVLQLDRGVDAPDVPLHELVFFRELLELRSL